MRRVAAPIAFICAIMTGAAVGAEDREGLTVFGAGSLREALSEITRNFGAAHGLQIRAEFGPSGRMRERIERGERVDLFGSADIGHARAIVEHGFASVMVMFARNTICALAPKRLDLGDARIVDELLDKATRIGISPPKIDPLGDYTVELYNRMGQEHAGAAGDLMARSTVIDAPPGSRPPRSGDANIDALQDGRIDVAIVYCSGRERYARLLPAAELIPLPSRWQVGPEYALAVLNDADRRAADLALYMLSPEGQAVFAQYGFVPVALPTAGR
jgi:molybdate transport system substrate-binding protein